MPVSFGIAFDKATLAKVKRELRGINGAIESAAASAINKTTKTARSNISKAVRGVIRVNKASADRRLIIKGRASRKNLGAKLSIERELKSRERPLITSFSGTRDTRVYASGKRAGEIRRSNSGRAVAGTGVLARPRVGGGQQRIKHAFIVTGRGGTRLAVARAKDGRRHSRVVIGKKKKRRRVTLVAMLGPTVLGTYVVTPGLRGKIEKKMADDLNKNLLSQISRFVK